MELLARNVQELAPLVGIVLLVCCLCSFGSAVRLRGCAVDELENEWSSSNDTSSSGQTVELPSVYSAHALMQLRTLTSLSQQCSQALNSFRWTAILRQRSEASLWDFGPNLGISTGVWTWVADSCARVGGRERHTPTVVKTSWSLFTRVISPGSFTLMLDTCYLSAMRGAVPDMCVRIWVCRHGRRSVSGGCLNTLSVRG